MSSLLLVLTVLSFSFLGTTFSNFINMAPILRPHMDLISNNKRNKPRSLSFTNPKRYDNWLGTITHEAKVTGLNIPIPPLGHNLL